MSPSAARLATVGALALVGCSPAGSPGYSRTEPGRVTCGCHDGPSCYDEAAQLASRRGEQAATAEELMYLTQCACFQGSSAGCNALGHFAKDAVKACEQGSKIDDSCTIAGLVYLHGVQVSPRHGRSYDRDPAIARRAFERACRAGAATACERLKN